MVEVGGTLNLDYTNLGDSEFLPHQPTTEVHVPEQKNDPIPFLINKREVPDEIKSYEKTFTGRKWDVWKKQIIQHKTS